MTDVSVPITSVRLGEREEALVLQVLRSGMLAQGPMVARLEELFAQLTGTRHAIAVNNGTTALVASLQALQLEPGDEVVTSPFTFVATLNAVLEAGAIARFADISLDDFAVRPDAVEAAAGPRTRAVMPVHLYGQAAPMDLIAEHAARCDLALVEDAAQAVGATIHGRPVGSFGLACFSLYATKNVTTGEGGIVTTNDDSLADRLRLLRNQGMRARYQYELAGHNYRMTDLQAAVGIPQIEQLAYITERRVANANALSEGLSGIPGLVLPAVLPGRTHVFHQYTVRVTADAPIDRDGLVNSLAADGIGAGVYYPRAVYDYECYRAHPRVMISDTRAAEQAAREVLSLPVHPYLKPADLERIVTTVRRAFRQAPE